MHPGRAWPLPIDFFKDAEAKGIPSARYVGELYFQAHRGTYTSQARTKKNTRKVEFALREAEFWGAAAAGLGKYQFPYQAILDNWQTVLLLQFHDILPGSSIRRVYQEAEAMHGAVIRSAQAIATAAMQSIGSQENGVSLFNSLSWDRQALVELPANRGSVADSVPARLYLSRTMPERLSQRSRCLPAAGPPSIPNRVPFRPIHLI